MDITGYSTAETRYSYTMAKKLTTEDFIREARVVHGDRYDYSKANYTNNKTKVTIVCKEHGDFLQAPYSHKIGQGCPKCGSRKSIDARRFKTEDFIERSKVVHGDRYDYSKVDYKTSDEKVTIICKEHGGFLQTANSHIQGHGCKRCGIQITTEASRGRKLPPAHNKDTTETFIEKAKKVHGGKYDYCNANYKATAEKVTIICKEHGEFVQSPMNHLQGCGCPKCSNYGPSNGELEVLEFIKSIYDGEVLPSERSLIAPKELDIVIPGKGIAIEFNGLYWHSEENGKDKNYHLDKTKACEAKGYQLIHIFENEWLTKRSIVESRLRAKLGLTERRIYARKCSIREVSSVITKKFLIDNHIQGNSVSSVKYGLIYENELVAVMTFGKSRYSKAYDWELLRFANKLNTIVVGGASKLFKHFTKNNPGSIISYSDKRWNNGKVYTSIGMKHIHTSDPCFWYFTASNPGRIYHRSKFQKHKLCKLLDNFDPSLTEAQNMILNGYNRIFDCGNSVFTYEP